MCLCGLLGSIKLSLNRKVNIVGVVQINSDILRLMLDVSHWPFPRVVEGQRTLRIKWKKTLKKKNYKKECCWSIAIRAFRLTWVQNDISRLKWKIFISQPSCCDLGTLAHTGGALLAVSQPFNGSPWQPGPTQSSPLCVSGWSLLRATGSHYMPYKAHPEIPGLVKYYSGPSNLLSHCAPRQGWKSSRASGGDGSLKLRLWWMENFALVWQIIKWKKTRFLSANDVILALKGPIFYPSSDLYLSFRTPVSQPRTSN